MFEPCISTGTTEKVPGCKYHSKTVACLFDMEGHGEKCVDFFCQVPNKRTEQLYKVSSPCVHNHQIKKEELESIGELTHGHSQIVLKCLYLSRIGRPDILWSVIKFARSVTKWRGACYRGSARLISYIHHTNDYHQFVMWVTLLSTVDWCLFQDSYLAGDLEDSESTSEGMLCLFGSRTLVPIGWMCKRHASVSHSSTVSLDAGLRMDGLPALDLWDIVIEVFRSRCNTNSIPQAPGRRSPTMRHVSRTHKVALGCSTGLLWTQNPKQIC